MSELGQTGRLEEPRQVASGPIDRSFLAVITADQLSEGLESLGIHTRLAPCRLGRFALHRNP